MDFQQYFIERIQANVSGTGPIVLKANETFSLPHINKEGGIITFVLRTMGDDVSTYAFAYHKETASFFQVVIYNKTNRRMNAIKSPEEITAIIQDFVFIEDQIKNPDAFL